MEKLTIKDASASDKLHILGTTLYTDTDMIAYALYILNNDVITPREWVEKYRE